VKISFFAPQKPYRCEVANCPKRYTDPSSLRKHIKSHSLEEQAQYKKIKDAHNLAKQQQLLAHQQQSRGGSTGKDRI